MPSLIPMKTRNFPPKYRGGGEVPAKGFAMVYECRHIMHNGEKCHSPALRATPYCYYHTRLHRFTAKPPIGVMGNLHLPVLEDRSAILLALAQVFGALTSSNIDAKRAGLLLYGLQIASQNVDKELSMVPVQSVESVSETGAGEELGPQKRYCNPWDCAKCGQRETCQECDQEEEEDRGAPAGSGRPLLRLRQEARKALSNVHRELATQD